ncbi:MAG: hypothetical protein ABIO70_13895 [Pseudomonadota bacterium]
MLPALILASCAALSHQVPPLAAAAVSPPQASPPVAAVLDDAHAGLEHFYDIGALEAALVMDATRINGAALDQRAGHEAALLLHAQRLNESLLAAAHTDVPQLTFANLLGLRMTLDEEMAPLFSLDWGLAGPHPRPLGSAPLPRGLIGFFGIELPFATGRVLSGDVPAAPITTMIMDAVAQPPTIGHDSQDLAQAMFTLGFFTHVGVMMATERREYPADAMSELTATREELAVSWPECPGLPALVRFLTVIPTAPVYDSAHEWSAPVPVSSEDAARFISARDALCVSLHGSYCE